MASYDPNCVANMTQGAFLEREGFYVILSNGQTDHYYVDDFTDPWLSRDDKQVILIQPGFCRSAVFWYHWVPALARDFVVVRRDLRGHGKSSYPKCVSPETTQQVARYENNYEYSIETICAEIIDFLDKLSIPSVHFLGESTSGQIGHALAALHPDRITSLITCSTPTRLDEGKQRMLAMGQASWPEALLKLGSRGWAEALSSQAGTSPRDSPEYKEWWLSEVGKSSAEGLAGYAAFLSRLETRRFLPRIACPVLVLAPAHSAAVPVEESEYAARHIHHAELRVIESPGHEIYVEDAATCQRLVRAHLSRFAKLSHG